MIMRSSLNNIKLIADDGMFQEVMRYFEVSVEIVERLLHIKVGHVELQCYPQDALGKPIQKRIKDYMDEGAKLEDPRSLVVKFLWKSYPGFGVIE